MTQQPYVREEEKGPITLSLIGSFLNGSGNKDDPTDKVTNPIKDIGTLLKLTFGEEGIVRKWSSTDCLVDTGWKWWDGLLAIFLDHTGCNATGDEGTKALATDTKDNGKQGLWVVTRCLETGDVATVVWSFTWLESTMELLLDLVHLVVLMTEGELCSVGRDEAKKGHGKDGENLVGEHVGIRESSGSVQTVET